MTAYYRQLLLSGLLSILITILLWNIISTLIIFQLGNHASVTNARQLEIWPPHPSVNAVIDILYNIYIL